jgi:Family of unknown function (DUF5996)/RibD C-terminal domain
VATHAPWPELPWRDWQPTVSTLHMWTQIVGKVRLALSPALNHWWHIPLYVTARGLTTSRQEHLIDEYVLLIHPLVLGSGQRLFTDDGELAKFKLVDTMTTSKAS